MASILFIDDDLSLSDLLAEYLREQGYIVHTARDGQKGLRTFFEQKPDLMMLDVTMPIKDGWETLKRIREMSRAPVILLTARDESRMCCAVSRSAQTITSPSRFRLPNWARASKR